MGVSSITVWTPPDETAWPDGVDGILRPRSEVIWVGDVGPYDVLHEWDTATSFATGDLITDLNTGISHAASRDTGIPPSDMGGDKSWYYQVTVTDTDDAGFLTEPAAGDIHLDYNGTGPTSANVARWLYTMMNVGVDFGVGGGDGDPKDNDWFLHVNQNVIFDFGAGGTDPDSSVNNRHLYLYKYVDSTLQPCPFITLSFPETALVGDTITVQGDGFGATQGTYSGEVRIYDSADHADSSIALTIVSWTDELIIATIPAGVVSGWLSVIHTATPSCTGSNFKFLQVQAVDPDPDAGWWIEAWDEINVSQILSYVPVTAGSLNVRMIMNDIGSGALTVPLGHPAQDTIIDPAQLNGSLLKLYTEGIYRYSFWSESLRHDITEEGITTADISGEGLEAILKRLKPGAFDAPSNPTKQASWLYGSSENLLRNDSFDDSVDNPFLSNPGGEDGNDDEGVLTGWSTFGDVPTAEAVNDALDARTGEWYINIDPDEHHAGIRQTLSVEPNRTYHVQAYVKDDAATGQRITLSLGGADDIAKTGTYTNNYKYSGDNKVYAELDNVARNGAGNGCPGGATDGLWQVMDVEVKTGDEQTSLEISIQQDHHPGCSAHPGYGPFWVDDVTVEGWGLGLEPWRIRDAGAHATNSWRLDTTNVKEGTYSARLNPLTKFAGIDQIVAVNPNTKYTVTGYAITFSPAVDDTYVLRVRKNDTGETIIESDEFVPVDAVWNEYQVIFTADVDLEEITVLFAYTGPNNPSPIYIDDFSMVPGEPPSSAGTIMIDLLTRTALSYTDEGMSFPITWSFSTGLDSKGQPWPALLSLEVREDESLWDVCTRLVALGHEVLVAPINFDSGGESGIELYLYTSRTLNSATGVGVDHTNNPEGPAVHVGHTLVAGGRVTKGVFNVNKVKAYGTDGSWSEVFSDNFVNEKDDYGIIEDVIQVDSTDQGTLAQAAQARIDDEGAREFAAKFDMTFNDDVRPFLHFKLGDTMTVDTQPYTDARAQRVRSITVDASGESAELKFAIDMDRPVFENIKAALNILNKLTSGASSENTGAGTGSVSTGVSSTIVVEDHTHKLDEDITGRTTSGDVSGTLPGPLSVQKVRGVDIRTTGAETGDVMLYDADSGIWIPGSVWARIFMTGGM